MTNKKGCGNQFQNSNILWICGEQTPDGTVQLCPECQSLNWKCNICKRELPVSKIAAWDFTEDYIECFDCARKDSLTKE